MVGVPGMLYAGNHGFERRSHGVTVIDPLAAPSIPAIADLLERVRFQAELAGVDEGMIFENKGVTGSIHYRLAHDQEAARVWLLPVISDLAAVNGLRISEGRLVIEIRPSARINKGTATRSIVEEHGIRGLVFLGDDITDLDAFRVGIDMRSAGLASVNVAVAAPESPPEVARLADVAIPGVETCVELLTMLADSNELGARDEEG
jgi:trehalose 6-phosphate phosphatase